MGYNGFGVMYAKYANGPEIDRIDIGDRNGVVLQTSSGHTFIYSDEYAAGDVVVIESHIKDDSTKVAMPLARHLRILSDIHGYDSVKALVDGMPAELRGGRVE